MCVYAAALQHFHSLALDLPSQRGAPLLGRLLLIQLKDQSGLKRVTDSVDEQRGGRTQQS